MRLKNVATVNRDTLMHVNSYADKRGYNRVLNPSYLGKLPEDTVFVVDVMMIHEHAMGKKVAPHLRCMVQWKETPASDVNIGFLDVPMSLAKVLFKELPSLDTEEEDE